MQWKACKVTCNRSGCLGRGALHIGHRTWPVCVQVQLLRRQGPLEKRDLLLHTLVVQSAYLNACTLLRYDALHGPRPPLTQTAFCPPFGDAVKCSSALHCFFTLLTHRGFFDSSAPPKGTYVAPCVRADPRPKSQGYAAPSPGARKRRCYSSRKEGGAHRCRVPRPKPPPRPTTT